MYYCTQLLDCIFYPSLKLLHAISIVGNIAAVEFGPTSATLHTTNLFVYPPFATFRTIVTQLLVFNQSNLTFIHCKLHVNSSQV